MLTIDAGAVAALRSGKSLLPAGVIRVDGTFARGDAVVIRGPDGAEVGRGLVAYDAEDAAKIRGRSSADILSILGFGGRTEMVHRDDLVVGRAAERPLADAPSGQSCARQMFVNGARLPALARSHDQRYSLSACRRWRSGSDAEPRKKEDPGARRGQGLSPDG